jgi:protein-S-isoprenylcysteine O-methyltransferase Ste14
VPIPPAVLVLGIAWGTFALVWALAALGTARTVRRSAGWDRFLISFAVLAMVLVMRSGSAQVPVLGARWVPDTPPVFASGTLLLAAGIGFAFWARAHLGRFWSGAVVLKEGHQLVRSGPYAIVRNPIYTGLLVAFLGTALLVGTAVGFAALAAILASFLLKIRAEERLLAEQFGEAFEAYRREVKRLVPGVW